MYVQHCVCTVRIFRLLSGRQYVQSRLAPHALVVYSSRVVGTDINLLTEELYYLESLLVFITSIHHETSKVLCAP